MERGDNSWGGAAVHELVSPLYEGSNKEERSHDYKFCLTEIQLSVA